MSANYLEVVVRFRKLMDVITGCFTGANLVAFSIVATGVIIGSQLWAATISQSNSDPDCDYILSGTIEEGDAQRLMEIILPSSFGSVLCLNSDGGSFLEGIRLFRAVWESGTIVTRVRPHTECISACALAFLGGSREVGTGFIRSSARILDPGGQVGFHAPALIAPTTEDYSHLEIQMAYEIAIRSVSDLYSVSQIEQNGTRGINPFIMQSILQTPPSELYYINTIGRASLSGIQIPFGATPEITWRGLMNVCNTAVILSDRRNLQLGDAAFNRFNQTGVDGWGRDLPFRDRLFQDTSENGTYVIRGYPGVHNNEMICRVRFISRDEFDPLLPDFVSFSVQLWVVGFLDEDFEEILDDFPTSLPSLRVPWYSALDPSLDIDEINR